MAIFYTDSGSFGDITVSGSAIVSGTLSFAENSGGLTGSLFGTSSWANNAQSASFIEFISIANKPELVSSSGQISITQTTGYSAFSSSIATKNDTQDISINSLNAATSSYAINSTIQGQLAGVVSSSTQVKTLLPQDTVSSSAFASPSQGTVRATINNVQTDVDTGLQTGDSPSFTGLTLSGLTNTTATNKILVLNTSTNQIFTTESIGGGSSTSAFPFSGAAVITGSLLVSGSGIRTTGSLNLVSGSATFRNEGTPLIINGNVIHTNFEAFPRIRVDLGTNGVYFGSTEIAPELTDDYGLGSPTNRWKSLVVNQVTASIVSASTAVTASSIRVPGRIDVTSPANPASSMSISVGDVAGYALFKVSSDVVYYDFGTAQIVVNAGLISPGDIAVRGAIKDDFNTSLRITGGTANSTQITGSAAIQNDLRVNGGLFLVDSTNNRVNVSGSTAVSGSLALFSSSLTINTGSLTVDQPPGQTSGITLRVTGSNQVLYIGNDGQGSSFFKASNTQLRFGLLGDPGFAWNGTDLYPDNTDTENLGTTSNRWNRLVVNQVTASNVQLNSLTDTTATNKVLVLDTATNRIFTTASVGTGGGPGGAAFPYNGETVPAVISGSLIVSGSRGIYLSGSALTGSIFSGSFFNIIEMSMAVSGTITASGTTTVTLDMNKANYYTVSGSGAGTVTWVIINPPPVGRAQTFIVDYTNGGTKTNSWFTNTRWPVGVAPTLTATNSPDVLAFTTDDAGANWRGVLLQRSSQ